MRIFKKIDSKFNEIATKKTFSEFNLERELEDWIKNNPHLLGDIMIIGRQVPTERSERIDLLGLDIEGNLIVIEIKRETARRELVSQINSYLTTVKKWEYDDIEKVINKGSKISLERVLIKKYQEHFNVKDIPQFNREQKGVIIAEEFDKDFIDDLKSLRFSINVIKFSLFTNQEGEIYLIIDDNFQTESDEVNYRQMGKNKKNSSEESEEDNEFSTEEVEMFFKYFDKVEPYLKDVFNKSEGWKISKSKAYCFTSYYIWKNTNGQRFGFGLLKNENKQYKFYIGVAVNPHKYGHDLYEALKKDETKLKNILGDQIKIEKTNTYNWCPIWEYVIEDNPKFVADRLKIYKETLMPYLDKILPPRLGK